MSEPVAVQPIADEDVMEQIQHLLTTYPPLTKDRPALHITILDGAVTVAGHVQSGATRRYLLSRLPAVEGVKSVEGSALHDDLTIRLEVSKLIPLGVQANVLYGTVVLAGEPAADVDIEALANRILAVNGVAKVMSAFGG
jgi:hypothetical protein